MRLAETRHINLEDKLVGLKNKINSSKKAINNDKIIMFMLVATVAGFVIFIACKAKEQRLHIVISRENSSSKSEKSSEEP